MADDWYVLDSEPNSHVLVVYRGSNDAWDGYGGGTLYTKVSLAKKEVSLGGSRARRINVGVMPFFFFFFCVFVFSTFPCLLLYVVVFH